MFSYLKQKPFVVPVAILLGLMFYFTIFVHLENLAVRRFDEGRLAGNAYEMSKNGNYIVTYYNGAPDMWNTKPPLMIWAQVFFIKIFGVNELSVRLPAALAALFTCIALILFSSKFLKKPVYGIIASVILITSTGFIESHFSRTGDYDAMLTLFITLYVLCFFIFCESTDNRKRNRFLALFFLGLCLAVLTKGIAGLFFTPALLIFAVARKQFVPIIRNKKFYLFAAAFITVVASWYLLRESMNEGYIKAVLQNEVGGRFLETIESHEHGPFYYYDFIIDTAFKHWYIFVLPGLLLGFFLKEKRFSSFSVLLSLLIVSYLLIISNAGTKIHWYVMPMFPFLAFSAAMFFYWVFIVLEKFSEFFPAARKNVAPYLLLVFIFWKPYDEIFSTVFHPKEYEWEKDMGNASYYLRDAGRGKRNLDGALILHEDNRADLDFYVSQLKEYKQYLKFTTRDEVGINDTVVVYAEDLKIFLGNKFEMEILDQWKNVDRARIIGECPK